MNALKHEGAKDEIRVNAIAPLAATRMTEGLLPPAFAAQLTPEAVSAGVLYLASEAAPTGVILSAGGGVFSAIRIVESLGADLGLSPSPEAVRDQWAAITATEGERGFPDLMAATMAVAQRRS
jgi:hypothetical protein